MALWLVVGAIAAGVACPCATSAERPHENASAVQPTDSPGVRLPRFPPDPTSERPTPAVRRLPPVERRLPETENDQFGGSNPAETLHDVWRIAVSVDHQIAAKRFEISASESHRESVHREHWPSVSVDVSYMGRSAQPEILVRPQHEPTLLGSFPVAQAEGASLRGWLDFPIYSAGRIGQRVAAAEAQAAAARLEGNAYTRSLKLAVAEDFLAVLRAERHLEVAESTVRSLDGHAGDTRRRYEQHQAPLNNLLAAEVARDNARQRAMRARTSRDAAQATLNRRLGRPLDAALKLAEPTIALELGSAEELTRRSLRRPELAKLSAEARALEHEAQSLLKANWPQVSLRGEYAYEENVYRAPEGIAAAGVGVEWGVYDGGQKRAEAAALYQKVESLRCLRREMESAIALQIRRAWLEAEEAARRIRVAEEAIVHADENLRATRERYRSGLGTSSEVLDAESLRSEAHFNWHNARYDAATATLRLQHAAGDL
ncbi:MAG: TolC family protein [Planctomycetota bacterium]